MPGKSTPNPLVYIRASTMVSGLGLDLADTWSALLEGKSSIKVINRFDTDEIAYHRASTVQMEGKSLLTKALIRMAVKQLHNKIANDL